MVLHNKALFFISELKQVARVDPGRATFDFAPRVSPERRDLVKEVSCLLQLCESNKSHSLNSLRGTLRSKKRTV